jgi:hypothetical protein
MPQLVTPQTLKAIKIVRDHQILSGSAVLGAIRPDLKTCIDVRIGDTRATVCAAKVSKWAQSIEKSRPGKPVAVSIDGEYLSLTCESSFIRLKSQFQDAPDVDSVSLIERNGFLEVPAIPDKESMKAVRAEVAHTRKVKAQYRACEKADGALSEAKSNLECQERGYQASLEYLASHSFDDAVRLAHLIRRARRDTTKLFNVMRDYLITKDRTGELLNGFEGLSAEDIEAYRSERKAVMKRSGRSRDRGLSSLRTDMQARLVAHLTDDGKFRFTYRRWVYRLDSFQYHRRNVSTWGRRKRELLNEIEAAQLAFDEAKALYFEMKGESDEE